MRKHSRKKAQNTQKRRACAGAFAVLAAALFAISVQAQKAPAPSPSFDVVKIADGVFACIRREPASLWFNPNNVFIIGKKEVVVVDSNISAAYSREVIAALRKITDKPVKFLVNTHWHEDHIGGNRAWSEAYPDIQFVGHRSTLDDYPKVGAANRKQSVEGGADFVKMLRGTIEKGEDLAGAKMTEEERLGYSSDIDLIESYIAESRDFKMVLPTVLVERRLDIDIEGRKIEALFLGRAHTAADIVVRLPKENIVISGDLTVYPVPLVGSTSYPLEYGATLEKLLALKAKTIIPGHGPVMRDDAYLRLMIQLLNSIKTQIEAATGRGETLEQARKSVDLKEFEKAFCGDSQARKFVFQNYVTGPAVTAGYRQAKTSSTIQLTAAEAVTIDGNIDEKEWRGATAYDLEGGGKAFFRYDGIYLYVGVRGIGNGWSHLYLSYSGSADVLVHHASAALGMLVYRPDENKKWQTADKFEWELRDRGITTETQKKMDEYLSKNNWVANNNNTGSRNEIEFKIKPAGSQVRVALVYAAGDNDRYFFPSTLNDDTRKNDLVHGGTPADLKFDTSQWANIVLPGKK
jgi:cyclase